MEAAQPIGRFLGCQQSIGSMKMHAWTNPRYAWIALHKPKKEPPIMFDVRESEYMNDNNQPLVDVTVIRFDMSSFLEQCSERCIELAGNNVIGKQKPASTPFLDESKSEFDENEIIAKLKAAMIADMVESDFTKPTRVPAISQGSDCLLTSLLRCS